MGSPKAVAYLRVSTEAQENSGLGLVAQQAAIETAAARLGLAVAETFTDTVSGGLALEYRPGLLAALDALGAGDALIVAKRDRLGRDVLHVSMIQRLVERKGARVVSPDTPDDDSPTSILIRQILDAFSQFERQIIRQRTRAAMAVAKKQGRRVGQVPWGWRVSSDGRHLEPNLEERALLAEMWALRHQGLALIQIADDFNERGLRNRQGRLWQSNFIGQLLERHPENGNHA